MRLPNGLSLRSPNQNPVHASPLPHTRYMLRPSHSWFDYPNNTGWEQIIKLLIMKFSQLVLYTLIFKFWVLQTGRQRFCTEWKQAFPDFSLPLISSWTEFWFVMVAPKYDLFRPFRHYYQCLYSDFVQIGILYKNWVPASHREFTARYKHPRTNAV